MSMVINEQNLFKPARSRTETKADVTTTAARGIIEAETERREAKTARLREARLELEAQQVIAPPVKRPAARKQPAVRRSRSKA